MATREQILEALKNVKDPELGRGIVELGMVRSVEVTGEQVEVTLALTTMACPLKNHMANDIVAAIAAFDPALQTKVKLAEMTAAEKGRLIRPRTAAPGQAPEHVTASAPEPSPAQEFNHVKKIIAVLSGKGGVGKSSVSSLLAVALRRQGQSVGILDADITGPSIPRLFGLSAQPKVTPLGLMPPVSSTGIKVMSINLLLSDEDVPIIWRGPLITGAIQQFWSSVLWETLDTLIIDLPPGTSDATLTVMNGMPLNGIVLVTSPQDLAGMVVRKAGAMARMLEVPIIGLVENMSYVQCPDCGKEIEVFGPSNAEQTAQTLGVPLLGRVPLDPELAVKCDSGQIEAYSGEGFEPIAAAIALLTPEEQRKPPELSAEPACQTR
ncbi:MAG TPA: Mrp/NBP35 family ATP-binding protein [Anaerolineae bacterium]|nr:Mrp/NBP35 family ATP-binding protein [Anaerolineae bacterium]